jgi:hypothetical protein
MLVRKLKPHLSCFTALQTHLSKKEPNFTATALTKCRKPHRLTACTDCVYAPVLHETKPKTYMFIYFPCTAAARKKIRAVYSAHLHPPPPPPPKKNKKKTTKHTHTHPTQYTYCKYTGTYALCERNSMPPSNIH